MENKHGGKRINAGRQGKAEEQKLVEKLSPLEDTAHKKLREAINDGEKWAVELFFKYMYGLPKQVVDMKTTTEGSVPIKLWVQQQLNDNENKP
jgi:hypothetical protein